MSFGDEADVDYTTAKGRDWPSVRQFNVFLSNRMGALLDLVRRFEQTDIRVVSSNYERGYEILTSAKFAFTESDLLVVKLPDDDRPLLTITKALLTAEINICYMYPLLIGVGPMGNTAIAVYVDDFEGAAAALESQGFTLFPAPRFYHP